MCHFCVRRMNKINKIHIRKNPPFLAYLVSAAGREEKWSSRLKFDFTLRNDFIQFVCAERNFFRTRVDFSFLSQITFLKRGKAPPPTHLYNSKNTHHTYKHAKEGDSCWKVVICPNKKSSSSEFFACCVRAPSYRRKTREEKSLSLQ